MRERVEFGKLRDTRRRGHHFETLRRIEDDFLERTIAGQHVGQREPRREPQKNVDVGEAEIAVQQHDLFAALGERRGEIDRDGRLADAALSTRNGDDLDWRGIHGAGHS